MKLSQITGEMILAAYMARYETISDDMSKEQFAGCFKSRADKIAAAIAAGSRPAFQYETSLGLNYFGKVTRAIMDVMGIKKAKNLQDLYDQMAAIERQP